MKLLEAGIGLAFIAPVLLAVAVGSIQRARDRITELRISDRAAAQVTIQGTVLYPRITCRCCGLTEHTDLQQRACDALLASWGPPRTHPDPRFAHLAPRAERITP